MKRLVDRFIKYAKIHTTSDLSSNTFPSTDRQIVFMKSLKQELIEIGLEDVVLDKNGYVMATIPANGVENSQVVGFIAHVDTSPDYSGKNVQPQVIDNYDGKVIQLKNNISIDPKEFPELNKYIGQSLITADGTTLLGADDKAGVAEIVRAAEILIQEKPFEHGKIRIGFTPDEEIGKGADKFDVAAFGADFAYTMDGGEIGELENENFNAAWVKITVSGKSVHPGYAKDKMVNAIMVANQIINLLPAVERPEHTQGYEGFYHIYAFKGDITQAEIQILVRDFDTQKFQERKQRLEHAIRYINNQYDKDIVEMEMVDQYYNMKEKIRPVSYIIDIAEDAMKKANITPNIKAIRGGTDGARLSFMGLPCPNIFAGGHNFHGPYEFVPIPSMQKAVEVILNIVQSVAKIEK